MMTTPSEHYRPAIAKAESELEIYDAIIAEGKLVFLRFRDDQNSYAMHKAFEWMHQECIKWLDEIPPTDTRK